MVPSDEISTPPLEGSNAAEPIGAGAAYVVSLPVFEGPLDLLLHLIQKHELDIFDVPVSFVTQKYLEYLSLMQELQIDVASEYLVMAATLAHIKSKTLLPPESTAQQEEPDLEEETDPRAELIRRLLEYQKYKDAAGQLDGRGALGRDVFLRGSPTITADGPAPLAPVGVFSLLDAFGKVLERAQVKIEHEISFDRLTISERIQQLCERLAGRKRWRFEELFEGQRTRFDLIITFLALLEMTRLKLTRLYQPDPLAEIVIELAANDSLPDEPVDSAGADAPVGADPGAAAGTPGSEAATPDEGGLPAGATARQPSLDPSPSEHDPAGPVTEAARPAGVPTAAEAATTAGASVEAAEPAAEGEAEPEPVEAAEGEEPAEPVEAAEGEEPAEPVEAAEGEEPVEPVGAAEGEEPIEAVGGSGPADEVGGDESAGAAAGGDPPAEAPDGENDGGRESARVAADEPSSGAGAEEGERPAPGSADEAAEPSSTAVEVAGGEPPAEGAPDADATGRGDGEVETSDGEAVPEQQVVRAPREPG